MKRMFGIILIILAQISFSFAEPNMIMAIDTFIQQLADCSGKNVWDLKSNNYDDEYFSIQFDLRDGWKAIAVDDGDGTYRIYHQFDDNEILSAYFQSITIFEKIETSLGGRKKLKCKLYLYENADGSAYKIVTTSSTIDSYYQWLSQYTSY